MKLRQQHFIGGDWVHGGDGEFASTSPVDDAQLWQGPAADAAVVDRAVGAARDGFGPWSELDFGQRQGYVTRFVELVAENREQLAQTIHRETGKPLWESKTEIGTMIAKADVSAKSYEARTGYSESIVNGVQLALQHRPIGVFGVLGPYNFPGHLPNGHIIPALLAGNTIVFKPSELTPWFGEQMTALWQEAGLPPGVVNLVQGGGETGRLLVDADDINGLLFTGSSKTGHAIHRAFAGRPDKMLALEMGGNNPLVVDAVEDIAAAVYTIIQSAFISAGQRCTCARRLILVRSGRNTELLDALVAATGKLKVGVDDTCFMGPVVSNGAADRVEEFVAGLAAQGGVALKPLERPDPNRPLLLPAIMDVTGCDNAGEPGLDGAVAASGVNQGFPNDEECFGPVLQVRWVDSLEQAIAEANATRYGLSAGIISDVEASWKLFTRKIRAGIVNLNRPLTGASGAAPFGGVGASGNYRPGAYYAADYCAYPMASMHSTKVALPETLSPGIEL